MQHCCYVFFAQRPAYRVPLSVMVRMARRRPKMALQWFLTWLIGFLSWSDLVHVAIAYRGAVLNVTLHGGNEYYALIPYVATYPGLCRVVEVPLAQTIDLDRYPAGDRKRIFPTIARWATGGRIRTTDCVCITCDLLIAGGLSVPRNITTPQHLHDWLIHHGYKHESLGPY